MWTMFQVPWTGALYSSAAGKTTGYGASAMRTGRETSGRCESFFNMSVSSQGVGQCLVMMSE